MYLAKNKIISNTYYHYEEGNEIIFNHLNLLGVSTMELLNTAVRFDISTLTSMFDAARVSLVRGHHMELMLPFDAINAVLYRNIVAQDTDSYQLREHTVMVYVSLSQLTYEELLSLDDELILKDLNTSTVYADATPTDNRHIWNVIINGIDHIVLSEDGSKPTRKHLFADKELVGLLNTHNWNYQEESDPTEYKYGMDMHDKIIARIQYLGRPEAEAIYEAWAKSGLALG